MKHLFALVVWLLPCTLCSYTFPILSEVLLFQRMAEGWNLPILPCRIQQTVRFLQV